MQRILILLITLFFCIHSYGIQPHIVNFKNIDNKQGLSQNGITSIFQDRDGYMWFGTHYGLNRYDGINIKTFYAGNSFNELSDNTINSITQDLLVIFGLLQNKALLFIIPLHINYII